MFHAPPGFLFSTFVCFLSIHSLQTLTGQTILEQTLKFYQMEGKASHVGLYLSFPSQMVMYLKRTSLKSAAVSCCFCIGTPKSLMKAHMVPTSAENSPSQGSFIQSTRGKKTDSPSLRTHPGLEKTPGQPAPQPSRIQAQARTVSNTLQPGWLAMPLRGWSLDPEGPDPAGTWAPGS